LPNYYHLYVESRSAEGWGVPPDFEPEPWSFDCHRHLGQFAWVHPRYHWTDLFWGSDASFPMRRELPEERCGSAFFRYLDSYYDYTCDEDKICWLPYEDLLIDCWEEDTVTVKAKVPSQFALIFGNGRRSFPHSDLISAGVAASKLDDLRNGRVTRDPIDVTFGERRFQITELPPDREVEVSWVETIRNYIGESHTNAFRRLRHYGRDEDLRILSMRG